MKFRQDGGYGWARNQSLYILLYHMFNEEQRKKYEKELEKEDPKKFKQFKEYIIIGEKARKYWKNKEKESEKNE
ncbi:MAG: hypothetical protein E7Z76_07010 [Methanobrevibacter sp.]|nr:hypothetical protein [Methanobrevibacter sp.]